MRAEPCRAGEADGQQWPSVALLVQTCPDEHQETGGLEVGTTGCSMSNTLCQEGCLLRWSSRVGVSGSSIHPGQETLLSPQPSLDRRAQENTGPVEQRSKRHSKQRKQARCREQRSPGVRGHCFCSRHPRQKVFILGERWLGRAQAPSPPHKLSLLEVVLAPSSVSRAQSRRSQFSGTLPSVPSIQGWAAIWSREGLSEGRRERHHSISCWHSGETLLRKKSLPRKISSSCSKGMSPHTMS